MCRAWPALRAWMRPCSGPAEQREVADEIEDLVADELVAEAQRAREDAGVVEDDGVVQAAAARQSPRAQLRDLAREAEGPRRSDARREFLGPEREGQLLAAHDRMRKVDLVGDGQSGSVRLVEHAAVVADDLDRLVELDRPDDGVLPLESGGVEQAHEGKGRAVDDRDFRTVDLDEAVVEAQARRPPRARARPCRSTRRRA